MYHSFKLGKQNSAKPVKPKLLDQPTNIYKSKYIFWLVILFWSQNVDLPNDYISKYDNIRMGLSY